MLFCWAERGIQMLNNENRNRFYKSTRWKKTRAAYARCEKHICERCGDVGKIVHHKTHLTDENFYDCEIAFDFENLELLCQDCHNKEHFKTNEEIDEKLFFDVDGNIKKSPPV